MPSFNLIDKPWLPCLDAHGVTQDYSLRHVLLHAHELAALRDQSPLATLALHRLLLAVLHRAYDGPQSEDAWRDIWAAGQFDADRINAYLDRWHHRFDLFDEEHPFYQVAGFDLPKRAPIAQLVPELATGNNATLFDHTSESQPIVATPDAAARWLVLHQAGAIGGGKGSTSDLFGEHPYLSHGPLVGGVSSLLKHDSLYRTLCLNLLVRGKHEPPPVGYSACDLPIWERAAWPRPGPRMPDGWVDLLTWASRCVRLFHDGQNVTDVAVAQGASLSDRSAVLDPMWFYRVDEKKPSEIYPTVLSPTRALWRSADVLFAVAPDESRLRQRPRCFGQLAGFIEEGVVHGGAILKCWLIGLANDKAKLLRWTTQEFPVPADLLTDPCIVDTLRADLAIAEATGAALRDALFALAASLLQGAKDNERSPDKEMARRLRDGLQGEPRFWASMEIPFHDYLRGLAVNPREARQVWRETLHRQARAAFDLAASNSLARSARELHARVQAEGVLAAKLAKLDLLPKPETADA